MSKKMTWGLAVLVTLILTATAYLILQPEPEREGVWIPPDPNVSKPEWGDAEPGFKWVKHGDHWDKVPIESDDTVVEDEQPPDPLPAPEPPSRDYEPVEVQIPDGITDPDVLAAWERVDYIANNIWEWGGVPSNEAVQLMEALMPPPTEFSGPSGHSDAEETINLLGQLGRYRDPRAAEVVVTYYCGNIIGGLGPRDIIVDIGPPAVPLLLPYLFEDGNARAVDALGGIAVKYRKEIGGIVEHIIIPKLEEIVTGYGYEIVARKWAQEALDNLK